MASLEEKKEGIKKDLVYLFMGLLLTW